MRRGDFLWRISTARIEKGAPFSLFPAHDRVLTILSGNGVQLAHAYEEGEEPELVDLPVMEPYEFPGDVVTQCALTDGPVADLSVFFAKEQAQVVAQVVSLADGEEFLWQGYGNTGFVFVVEGSVSLDGMNAAKGETLRIDVLGSHEDGFRLSAGLDGSKAVLMMITSG